MPDFGFHFANPLWLLALLLPLLVYLWLRLTTPRHDIERYRNYADAHLLPYLLGIREMVSDQQLPRFIRWTALWTLLVIAMAGPRWNYTDIQLFRPGNDLMVLLDLSQSMNTADVTPSRLARARQEIDDILRENNNARVGLVGFATLAYVVAPLTEDTHSLHSLLPALTTDLTKLKGSRLSEALIRAQQLFAAQPEDSGKHILLVTDGDFADNSHEKIIDQLVEKNIRVHVLGIGTVKGGKVTSPEGRTLRARQGGEVKSRLNETSLQAIATRGKGIYRTADFNASDTSAILDMVNQHTAAAQATEDMTRIWNEQFYWLLMLALLAILPGYRLMTDHHSGQD